MTMLYLSRLKLTSLRRDVQRDLADCHDMHQRILSAFPDESTVERARKSFGVLYRVDQSRDSLQVLVQSEREPDWSRLPTGYVNQPPTVKRIDPLYEQVRRDMELHFLLRANPTRRISDRNTTQDERWRGKRVELRREEDQQAWLRRKGEDAGFALVGVRTRPEVDDARVAAHAVAHGFRRETRQLTFGSVLFEGRLRVTDADRFRRALVSGLGSGKAYGFGLLSVAPLTAATE